MIDHADRKPEESIDLPHPCRVATREVIVHRDHMHAAAFERVQIDRECRDERLPFSGAHLRNPATVKDDAAQKLNIVVTLAERAPRCLAHQGEGFVKYVVECFALSKSFLELRSLPPECIVRKPGKLRFKKINSRDIGCKLFQGLFSRITKKVF